jgi:hypothetical protein
MDNLLDTYAHLKLNQEEVNHIRRSSLQKTKVQELTDSLQDSTRLLKKN